MTKTWFSKALGDGVDAHGPSGQIQSAFMPIFAAAGQPRGMAVFSRYDLEANVVTAYFTPEAAMLAQSFGATPCDKPSAKGIGLLVGDQGAWQIYFPERRP